MQKIIALSQIVKADSDFFKQTDITKPVTITYLKALVESKYTSNEIKILAAQTIINEVYEDKHAALRLDTLRILLPLIDFPAFNTTNSYGQIDLHTHTLKSDGRPTGTGRILEAIEQGVFGIAITDHNVFPTDPKTNEAYLAVNILNEFLLSRENKDKTDFKRFELIAGTELDIEHEGTTIHGLVYIPDFVNRYDELMSNKVMKVTLEKLQGLDEERIVSSKTMLEAISKEYPQIAMTWETFIGKIRCSQISRATVTDVLFNEFPLFFKEQGITQARDVWATWLPKKLRPPEKYKNRLSLEEVALLMNSTGAKFAMAHPEEVFAMERKEGKSKTIEKYFDFLINKMEEGLLPIDAILGIAYFSKKLGIGAERNTIRNMFFEYRKAYPFLITHRLPESDTHGKTVNHPPGLGIDYPEHSTAYRAEIYEALGIDQNPLHNPLVRADQYGRSIATKVASDWSRLFKWFN